MRLGGRQVAGYFAAPIKVIRAIGALLRHDGQKHGRMQVVDPCAGDGEAVCELAAAIERVPVRKSDSNIFACELEANRAAALERRLRRSRRPELGVAVHGDAFRMRWNGGVRYDERTLVASIAYLNPPYDTDPDFGRLEERWLQHFLPMLNVAGGVLVFLIPITAITASIDTLAKNFTGLVVYRFPDPYYETFKQVAVIAKRRAPTFRPDTSVVATLRGYAADPASIPVLPLGDVAPIFMVPTTAEQDRTASSVMWRRRALDADAVARALKPWRFGEGAKRVIPGVLPENGVRGYSTEHFTVALPLRPGHVAPALAVGVFDGVRVVPDDRASGLPPVFAKATFVRDWTDVKGGERYNSDDELISKLQVQQPRLVMTALDLRAGRYVKIASSLERRSSTDLEKMTAADFLEAYNNGLQATLRKKCTPLYDPADPNRYQPAWDIERPLWDAQVPPATAALLCIEKYGGGLIEGQTGTGKTSMGVAVASALRCKRARGRTVQGARRTLVVCPPHLLAEWLDEIAVLRPDAKATVIHDVHEADAFAAANDNEMTFGILAETTGKLAHGWVGVGDHSAQPVHVEPKPSKDGEIQGLFTKRSANDGASIHVGEGTRAHRETYLAKKRHHPECPACGAAIEHDRKHLATKRLRCGVRPRLSANDAARFTATMARVLAPVLPLDEAVTEHLSGRFEKGLIERWKNGTDKPDEIELRWYRARRGGLTMIARDMVAFAIKRPSGLVIEQLPRLFAAIDDSALAEWAARALVEASLPDVAHYGNGERMRDAAGQLCAMVRETTRADALVEELRAKDPLKFTTDRWNRASDRLRRLRGERSYEHHGEFGFANGAPLFYGERAGSLKLARGVFEVLRSGAEFEEGEACTEPLFAAVPDVRRTPLARYLARRWKHRIDLAIIDEIHENGSEDSAQTQAMEQFRGRPMLGLTGTISNGYVKSLFAILRTFSPLFRQEFDRGECAPFRERYGYQKRILKDVDRETKKVVAFGTSSNRVVRQMQAAGDAPGALPSFILRHFLPIAAPLHLEDLNLNLPPSEERVEMIDPGPLLGPRVRVFQQALVDQIAADRFSPLQGKLFGQMSEEWSSADRAALGVGNSEDGIYRACYPESVGGSEVCRLDMMPADFLLPKEQRLVEIVSSELAEGRNVLIGAWHSHCGLYERLAKILKDKLGITTPILDSTKVPARSRKDWLKKNIVGKAQTMIVNPASIETGFNALTWFATLVWFQPPACAPKTALQTMGRIRRPGQKLLQRFIWLVYRNTSQVTLHQLLKLKMAESMAVDGTDNTAMLRAAGVDPVDGVGGFDLGRALYTQARKERGFSE